MGKVKSEYINPEKFKFILDLMRPDNANAVRVCLITGLRIGDALALKRDQITEGGVISTVCDKTDKPFLGEIPSGLARELLRRAGGSEWLFPSPAPQSKGKHRTRQAVWYDIKRAAKICAVPRNVSPHTARKIYAVDKFRKDGLEAVQSSLQHDRLATTLIYAFSDQLVDESKKKQAEKPVSECETAAGNTEREPSRNTEQILSRFFEAFGGREAFAEALREFAK